MVGDAPEQNLEQGPQAPGHLIHVGYPKAGSTFLQEWFASHPQLAYVKGGIAGYSNVWEIASQAASNDPDVLYRVTSEEQLTVPTIHTGTHARPRPALAPSRAAQENVCAELKRLFPDARVLMVTRGFRSAWLSAYSQYVREAGTLELHAMAVHLAGAGCMWNYDDLIRTYRAAFGERLIVLPYELLRDDPRRFVDHLAAELGLTAAGPFPGRVNRSLSSIELGWYPRLSRLVAGARASGRLRRLVMGAWGRATYENRLAPLIRLLQVVRPMPPVDAALVTDDLLEPLRGQGEALRGRPLYAGYEQEYLL